MERFTDFYEKNLIMILIRNFFDSDLFHLSNINNQETLVFFRLKSN